MGSIAKKELIRPIPSKISYNSRVFASVSNTANGEVDGETLFYYHQTDNVVWAEYHGGAITKGFIIGNVDEKGVLHFIYQHINIENKLKIGKCISKPSILPDGRIRLFEKWQWLDSDNSSGESIIEEIRTK